MSEKERAGEVVDGIHAFGEARTQFNMPVHQTCPKRIPGTCYSIAPIGKRAAIQVRTKAQCTGPHQCDGFMVMRGMSKGTKAEE